VAAAPWRGTGLTVRRAASIRSRLLLLAAALLVPAVLVAAVLLWRAYHDAHQAAERQLADTARALSLAVDRQIGQARTLLDALATSVPLRDGDLPGFVAQARAADRDPDRWVVVLDAAGRQVATSGNPRSVLTLPRQPRTRALGGGDRLWNLSRTAPDGRPVVAIARSVPVEGVGTGQLVVVSPAAGLRRLFAEQRLPAAWTGVVVDTTPTIVARSRAHDRLVGHAPSPAMVARLREDRSGVAHSTTLEGIASITAWNTSSVTGWSFVVAVPRPELAAGARASLAWGAALGALALGLGVLIAWITARRIVVPLEALAETARALGRGEIGDPDGHGPREVGTVRRALAEAGHARRAREEELRQLAATLEQRVAARTRELADTTETLVQAQKMEAVGQLTGGIAHDFNNLLTAVLGNLELIARGDSDPATARRLAAARSAAERGARLTGQLLAFSRRQRLTATATDLNALVEGTVDLLGHTLGGAVQIVPQLRPDLPPAQADPIQLELVLINLAINARDALPGGGTIRIETARASIKADDGRRDEAPEAGEYLTVTVTDTGTGMSPEVRARIFEPFFTTKPIGQGTGLGLSQALGVVKQLGGGIEVASVPGAGTSITLFLPLAQDAAAAASDATSDAEAGGPRRHGGAAGRRRPRRPGDRRRLAARPRLRTDRDERRSGGTGRAGRRTRRGRRAGRLRDARDDGRGGRGGVARARGAAGSVDDRVRRHRDPRQRVGRTHPVQAVHRRRAGIGPGGDVAAGWRERSGELKLILVDGTPGTPGRISFRTAPPHPPKASFSCMALRPLPPWTGRLYTWRHRWNRIG